MASYYDQVNGLEPKVWYRFNETAGTPTNSGSLTTTSTFSSLLLNEQTDVDGRAVYFNGTDSYVNINAWPAFSLFDDKSVTIETWFKLSTQDTNNRPIFQFGSFAIDQITLRSVGTADANSGKLHLNITSIGEQVSDRDTYSTNTYFDNTWHHVVIAINTTSLKWYIDGQLEATKTLTTGTLNIDSLSSSPNTYRLIGASRSNTTGNISSVKHKGWLDEFAIYGYELTAQNVLDNFNAGASVDFPAGVLGTASALFVEPTLFQDTLIASDPMTASADGAGHAASTVDFPTLLDTYMSTLTLQTWFKFDKPKVLTDYGTEGTRTSIWSNDVINKPTGGIQGSGAIEFIDSGTNPFIFQQVPLATGICGLLNDEDFTIGFWTKKLNKEECFILTAYKGDQTESLTFKWNTDGGITFNIYYNNTDYSVASTSDITDGEWHFVVGKLSSNTMQLWVDGTSIGTNTMSHNLGLDYFQFEGTNSTDTLSISQFFVTTASAIGSTEIANIWDYGVPTFVQASAYMPDASARFDSAFNNYIQSKNPVLDFRLDEGSGSPVNYGSASIELVPYLSPQGFTQNEVGLNTRAFKFTSRDQTTRGNYDFESGTFSTDDICTIGLVFKNANATNQQGMVGFGGRLTLPGDGNGFSLQQLAPSGYLRILAGNGNGTVTTYTGTTNYADNKWHFAVIVKDASTVKLYVDGKEHISGSNSIALTDNGEFIIAGIAGIIASAASRETLIDEVFVTNTAFSAQEVFEAYQALRLEMDTTASAEFPMVTNIAGTGYIDTPTVKTASADFVMPTFSTDQVPTINVSTASAEFVLPNFGGNVVIDANYGHESFIADALFHDPQFNIGEEHAADHMDASALFVHPISIAAGSITVSSMVALDATLVQPGIVTVLGAQVFADPMRSNAIFPLPPAYIQLEDDDWYVRLYAGHFDGAKEPVQALLSNLPGQSSTSPIDGGFLTFFDDVTADITPTSVTNTIESEIGQFAYVEPDQYDFDDNGDLIPLNTTGNLTRATASRQSNTPQSILSTGLFDPYERKAVRVTNIEFPLPGTNKNFSERPYNIEFSIKTTKSDQILTHGYFSSPTSLRRVIGAIGLSDGKIYLAQENSFEIIGTGLGAARAGVSKTAPHPKNFVNRAQYAIGRKDIADGNWHHVVIQVGWTDNRTQIWIDGVLDRQIRRNSSFPGIDGTNNVRPYILGFNSNDTLLASDFETSAWNFYPGRFLDIRTINLNYSAYQKSKPIKVEPFTASLNMGQNTTATGNRSKALMLYWWPVEETFGSNGLTARDNGQLGFFDRATMDRQLVTLDLRKNPPQEYYGWHVFPMPVTGNFGNSDVSDLLKEGIGVGRNGFIDPITGSPRYIDLMNDIDISQFDAIFFRNFPEESLELDRYVREEESDDYFDIKENVLYDNFLKSLRDAIDTGVNLFITNPQLALDLGIIDRYDVLPVFDEGESDKKSQQLTQAFWDVATDKPQDIDDEYNPKTYPINLQKAAYFEDRINNMRHRVVNTLELLTDDASYIWTDRAYYKHSDEIDFGGTDRVWEKFEYRLNGLQPGDEFVFGNPSDKTTFGNSRWKQTQFRAVPFENVKAGKIITAQPLKYWKGLEYVDNPYANYAHSIALEPGDSLKGRPVGGKIFVSISEMFADYTEEYHIVDLYHDYWIDIAYENSILGEKDQNGTPAENLRDALKDKNSSVGKNYIELPAISGDTQNRYNHQTYWSRNDKFAFSQLRGNETFTGVLGLIDDESNNIRTVPKDRKLVFSASRARDQLGRFASGAGGSGSLFFQIVSGRSTQTMNVYVPNLLTRAFWWISDKIRPTGLVNRAQVMTATVAPALAKAIVDKDVSINVQSMLVNAIFSTPLTGTITDTSIPVLPLLASAEIVQLGKRVFADPFTASAQAIDPGTFTFALEEVILKIENKEIFLYLRGDKIR